MRRRTFVSFGAQLAGSVAALPLLQACGGGDAEFPGGQRLRASGAMAPPGARVYQAASGATVYGGRFANVLLELVAAAPANSWLQANLNDWWTVWVPEDFRPCRDKVNPNPGTPSSIIRAWSSFAWDPVRSRLVLYGGGHAIYDGNEVYVFDGNTRQWSLAYYPTDTVLFDAATSEYVTIDGPLNSPVSSHTFDNSDYLPRLGRFVTFGGAAAHKGGNYIVREGTTSRPSGPYTLDLAQAGLGMVGGVAGSNVKRRSTAGVNLPGANAWAVRDYYKDHPDPNGALPSMTQHQSSSTAYAEENGHDVLYLTTYGGFYLHRIEFVDADYRNDLISIVGLPPQQPMDAVATLAFDPVKRIALSLGQLVRSVFWGWDLSGPPRAGFGVTTAGLTGSGVAAWLDAFKSMHGIDYDAVNRRFVLWSEGGQVFGLEHDGGALTGNWRIEELRPNSGAAGVDRPKTRAELEAETFGVYAKSDEGVNGKWKWASDLNAFVGLQHNYFGNVWIYKPDNWVPPSSSTGIQNYLSTGPMRPAGTR
jgi:hypothetical protein